MTDPRPILVTGATGLVGSALIGVGGETTVGLSHDQLDICDGDAVVAALEQYRPRAVINAAAMARVDHADVDPELAFRVNGRAPGLLARACRRRDIRLVHLSTDYVLDGPTDGPPLTEDTPPKPRSTYARSKLAGEEAALAQDAVVVRIQWVYWPGRRGFFTTALKRLAAREIVHLVTDQVGRPTPARWLARQLLGCAQTGPTGLFHLAVTGEATAQQWILRAARQLGLHTGSARPTTRAQVGGAHRPARSCLDPSRFFATWGGRPPHWEAALVDALHAAAQPQAWLSTATISSSEA